MDINIICYLCMFTFSFVTFLYSLDFPLVICILEQLLSPTLKTTQLIQENKRSPSRTLSHHSHLPKESLHIQKTLPQ